MKRSAYTLAALLLPLLLAACAPAAYGPAETFRPLTPEYSLTATAQGEPLAVLPNDQGAGWRLETADLHLRVGFDEDKISSVYGPLVQGVVFELVNRSDEAIRILWDESTLVGVYGDASRIYHAEVEFVNADQSQPPTIVPVGAREFNGAWPTDLITHLDNDRVRIGYLIDETDVTPAHRSFRLILALEVGSERVDLELVFDNPAPIYAQPDNSMTARPAALRVPAG